MDAADLLARLRAEGCRVVAFEGDQLTIAPSSNLTPELRAAIRAHKLELLEELRGRILQAIAEHYLADQERRAGEAVATCPRNERGRRVAAR